MRIVGFNFKKVEAERKKDIKGKLEIKAIPQIDDIKKDKMDIVGDVLKISYAYEIKYEPEFAHVVFNGEILVIPDNEGDTKKILKDWKKKKIEDRIKIPIINFIMSKCNLKALQLEDELSLPLHIPLPRLTKKQQGETDYTG